MAHKGPVQVIGCFAALNSTARSLMMAEMTGTLRLPPLLLLLEARLQSPVATSVLGGALLEEALEESRIDVRALEGIDELRRRGLAALARQKVDEAAQLVDQKMAELEKQNLESRIFIMGAHKPPTFFNTH